MEQMNDGIKAYNDMAKTWVVKAGRNFFVSLLNDPTLTFEFNGSIDDAGPITNRERELRIMKLRVRAKGIV